jgi:hypothetical protein
MKGCWVAIKAASKRRTPNQRSRVHVYDLLPRIIVRVSRSWVSLVHQRSHFPSLTYAWGDKENKESCLHILSNLCRKLINPDNGRVNWVHNSGVTMTYCCLRSHNKMRKSSLPHGNVDKPFLYKGDCTSINVKTTPQAPTSPGASHRR